MFKGKKNFGFERSASVSWCFGNLLLVIYVFIWVVLLMQILDEMPVFYNLNAVEKREVLIVILQIVRNLDDASLVKAWQQSIARTRLFFKLLEESLILFEVRTYFLGVFLSDYGT